MQHMFTAGTHAMFPDALHDEQARQDFVRAMRQRFFHQHM